MATCSEITTTSGSNDYSAFNRDKTIGCQQVDDWFNGLCGYIKNRELPTRVALRMLGRLLHEYRWILLGRVHQVMMELQLKEEAIEGLGFAYFKLMIIDWLNEFVKHEVGDAIKLARLLYPELDAHLDASYLETKSIACIRAMLPKHDKQWGTVLWTFKTLDETVQNLEQSNLDDWFKTLGHLVKIANWGSMLNVTLLFSLAPNYYDYLLERSAYYDDAIVRSGTTTDLYWFEKMLMEPLCLRSHISLLAVDLGRLRAIKASKEEQKLPNREGNNP